MILPVKRRGFCPSGSRDNINLQLACNPFPLHGNRILIEMRYWYLWYRSSAREWSRDATLTLSSCFINFNHNLQCTHIFYIYIYIYRILLNKSVLYTGYLHNSLRQQIRPRIIILHIFPTVH